MSLRRSPLPSAFSSLTTHRRHLYASHTSSCISSRSRAAFPIHPPITRDSNIVAVAVNPLCFLGPVPILASQGPAQDVNLPPINPHPATSISPSAYYQPALSSLPLASSPALPPIIPSILPSTLKATRDSRHLRWPSTSLSDNNPSQAPPYLQVRASPTPRPGRLATRHRHRAL